MIRYFIFQLFWVCFWFVIVQHKRIAILELLFISFFLGVFFVWVTPQVLP